MVLPEVVVWLEHWILIEIGEGEGIAYRNHEVRFKRNAAIVEVHQRRVVRHSYGFDWLESLESSLRECQKRATICGASFREYDKRWVLVLLAKLHSLLYCIQKCLPFVFG